MYNTLPFGPVSLPTGPVFALLAAFLALDVAGRTGRRFRLHPDDVWNTGLLGLLAGLIVARLWTIIQFWPVYHAEPMLAFSLRPSGFAFWPGVLAALAGGYVFLIWKALDPARVFASLAVGIAAGAILINVSVWLTGAALGQATDLPWATRHFLDRVHPVGLYRALGMAATVTVAWLTLLPERPWRTIWTVVLGFALVHLLADAFLRDAALLGDARRSQVIALAAGVVASLALARESRSASQQAGLKETTVDSEQTAQPEPLP